MSVDLCAASKDRVVGSKDCSGLSGRCGISVCNIAVTVQSGVDLVTEAVAVGGGRAIGVAFSRLTCRLGRWITDLVGHRLGVANVLGSANTAFGYGVVLADNFGGAGKVARWGCGADLEDW